QDDATRVAVEAVDDAWAGLAAGVAELAEVELERIHQCPAPVSLGRVDDHVGRLVDNGQELIFVEDVERDVFGDVDLVCRLGQPDADMIIEADLVTCLGRGTIDGYAAGVDDLLHNGPAVVGEDRDQVLVEAYSFCLALDRQVYDLGARGGRRR